MKEFIKANAAHIIAALTIVGAIAGYVVDLMSLLTSLLVAAVGGGISGAAAYGKEEPK